MDEQYRIDDEAALAAVIGEPMEFLRQKIAPALDAAMAEFIRSSPLVFVATLDADGRPDVSPKGDPAGFAAIGADGELILPERPGNRLTFGFRNLLRDNRIGLIFVVPGVRETLRVKGTASLHRDPEVLERLAVNGRPALMYTRVAVQECFFHCGKALIRSKLWQPDHWAANSGDQMVRQLAAAIEGGAGTEELITSELEKSYREELY